MGFTGFISLSFALLQSASATPAIRPVGCDVGEHVQAKRSAELLKFADEDQADRNRTFDSIDWNSVNKRDLKRRKRAAEIFAEGCFKSAADYASAAVIYQHGTMADHFYQAFFWSQQAYKLGDTSQRWLTAASLDRYLVKIGHRQLFGTQLSRSGEGDWCLQPVEATFPESTRIEFVKFSVKEQIARTLKATGSKLSAEDVKECVPTLIDSPKGTVIGFW